MSYEAGEIHLSLQQFCATAQHMLANDHAEFARFVLSGEDKDGVRVVVNPLRDSDTELEYFTVTRDYDSLLGIDADIMVNCSLTAYPIARREDTLTKDIHISAKFTSSTVRSIKFSIITFIYVLLSRANLALPFIGFQISASRSGEPTISSVF